MKNTILLNLVSADLLLPAFFSSEKLLRMNGICYRVNRKKTLTCEYATLNKALCDSKNSFCAFVFNAAHRGELLEELNAARKGAAELSPDPFTFDNLIADIDKSRGTILGLCDGGTGSLGEIERSVRTAGSYCIERSLTGLVLVPLPLPVVPGTTSPNALVYSGRCGADRKALRLRSTVTIPAATLIERLKTDVLSIQPNHYRVVVVDQSIVKLLASDDSGLFAKRGDKSEMKGESLHDLLFKPLCDFEGKIRYTSYSPESLQRFEGNLTMAFKHLLASGSPPMGIIGVVPPTDKKKEWFKATINNNPASDNFSLEIIDGEVNVLAEAAENDLSAENGIEAPDSFRQDETETGKDGHSKCVEHYFIGVSPAARLIQKQIEKAAMAENATVRISGESGVGKEVVASAIHALSPKRSRGKIVALNCASLSEDIMHSELFGHLKGSFSGATNDRKGLFDEADRGTLFLDEIGDAKSDIQVGLLRAIQNKEVRPLGSNNYHSVNVRVISGTNRDLPALVQSGTFRNDLFYRLSVLEIHIPPLRDRREDLPLLIDHLWNRMQKRDKCPSLSGEVLEAIAGLDYDWPGNVRELENFLLKSAAESGTLPLTKETVFSLFDAHMKSGCGPMQLSDPVVAVAPAAENHPFETGRAVAAKKADEQSAIRRMCTTRRTVAFVGIVLAATVILSAGIIAHALYGSDDFRALVFKRGVPAGVSRVSANDRHFLFSHYHIKRSSGKPEKVQLVNWKGSLINDGNGVAQWQLCYRADGSIDRLEQKNASGTVVGVLRYGASDTLVEVKNRLWVPDAAPGMSGFPSSSIHRRKSGCTARLIAYDKGGYPISIRFAGFSGNELKSCPDTSGAFGVAYENYPGGPVRREWFTDSTGSPFPDRSGIVFTERKRDKNGLVAEECYLDVEKRPMNHPVKGYARCRYSYDRYGNERSRTFFDALGNHVLCAGRYAFDSTYFDGSVWETSCFGLDHVEKIMNDQGYHRAAWRYDERGRIVEQAFYDTAGKLTVTPAGYARHTITYESNGEILARYFDALEKPMSVDSMFGAVRSSFDPRGLLIARAFYDTSARRPVALRAGYSQWRASYDSTGGVTSLSFYDKAGNPVVIDEGFWRVQFGYNDANGNLSEVSYWKSIDERAVLPLGLFFCWKASYNGKGDQVLRQYFGSDDSLCQTTGGFSALQREYDKYGNELTRIFLDTKGNRVVVRSESSLNWSPVDEFLNGDHQSLYDVSVSGYAEIRRRYDDRGIEIARGFFDAGGKPLVRK